MKNFITMLVPAYNEEAHIEETVKTINQILKGMFKDYEILIFNDCSSDKTGQIVDALAEKNPKIKVTHNKKNMGLGYNYRCAVKMAQEGYFGWIPGDNDISSSSIKRILKHIGEADIIVTFTLNKKARKLHRRIVSSFFTNLLNLLFGLRLKYYNGIVIYKTEIIKKVKMRTNNFALQAETLIKLIKKGHSYKEVPMHINGVEQSNLFRLKNLVGVLTTIFRLSWELNFKK